MVLEGREESLESGDSMEAFPGAEKGRSHLPARVTQSVNPCSGQEVLLRGGQGAKIMNRQSWGPVWGVDLRPPPSTAAEPRDRGCEGEALAWAGPQLLWDAHPTGLSSHSLFEEVNPMRSKHP